MLSPTLFGYNSYSEVIEALKAGKEVSFRLKEGAGFLLRPVSKETFAISTFHRRDPYTTLRKNLTITFRLALHDIKRVIRSACSEGYSAGDYDGFQVVNTQGLSVTGDEAEVHDFDSAINLVKKSEGEAFLVPIPKGRAAIIKRMAPVFEDIKVLSNVVNGAYDDNPDLDEGHKQLAQRGLNIVGALDALGQDLQEEKRKNLRAQQILDAGKQPMTIPQDHYDDMFIHAETFKALMDNPDYEAEIRRMLADLEVESLNETVEFNPVTLLDKRSAQ